MTLLRGFLFLLSWEAAIAVFVVLTGFLLNSAITAKEEFEAWEKRKKSGS